MNSRFKFRLPFYNNNGEFSHFEFILIGESLPAYNAGVMFHRGEYEQCTGFSDKNGNLIYEGDIVRCDRDFSENGRKNLIRKVIFADGSFQLERAKNIGDRYYINAFHNFEIIGNIHEQAEQKDK